jgi:hypothetical protein
MLEIVSYTPEIDPNDFARVQRMYDLREELNAFTGLYYPTPDAYFNPHMDALDALLVLPLQIEGQTTSFTTWDRDERRVIAGHIAPDTEPYSWSEKDGHMLRLNGAAVREIDGRYEIEIHYLPDDAPGEMQDALGEIENYFAM